MSFGDNLKRLRVKANLTQEQLAIKLNISRQSISKWERDVGLPNLTYLKPLSKILKCTIEDLLVF